MTTWLVPLPRGAEPPYEVWLNGVPQEEGVDYKVTEGGLAFSKPLEKERIGLARWTAIFFGLWGSYGKNDSVDVQYRLGGRETVADVAREPIRRLVVVERRPSALQSEPLDALHQRQQRASAPPGHVATLGRLHRDRPAA